MKWIPRRAQQLLEILMAEFPAVAVIGARQTGKSALLNHVFPSAPIFQLDEVITRELLVEDNRLLYRNQGPVLIGEIQKMPALLEQIKVLVDQRRSTKGQFALTGSEQFQLMRGLQESLAGRVALMHLFPLSWQELEEAKRVERSREDVSLFMVRGGYPELWESPAGMPGRDFRWFAAYLSTYIERDVCAHFGIQHAAIFLKFLKLLSLRAGQLLNITELARDAAISVPTAREWLSILERSMMIRVVQPLHANLSKRLVKMPKVFFLDTGILSYLVGLDSPSGLERHPLRGAIYENAVFAELTKQLAEWAGRAEIYFFRTHDGLEVDFVVECGLQRIGIEVKSSGTASLSDLKGLRQLIEAEVIESGVVMTLQAQVQRMGIDVEAVPFWDWSILEALRESGQA